MKIFNMKDLKENEPMKFYELSVFCMGIKKRCRKVERHFFYGPRFLEIPNEEDIKNCAEKVLKENLKTNAGNKFVVSLKMKEITKENGFVSTKFMMFQDDYKLDFEPSKLGY